jgi:hypothetical protein
VGIMTALDRQKAFDGVESSITKRSSTIDRVISSNRDLGVRTDTSAVELAVAELYS